MVRIFRQFGKGPLAAILAIAVAFPFAPLNCLLCPLCSAGAAEISAVGEISVAGDSGRADSTPPSVPAAEPVCCGLCTPQEDHRALQSKSDLAGKGCHAGLTDSKTKHKPCGGCCIEKAPPADRTQLNSPTAPSFTNDPFALLPAGEAVDVATWNIQRRLEGASWLAELVPPVPHQVLHCSWLK